jgi:hypothetical protein
MDVTYFSAFAALVGAVIGALSSFSTSWLSYHIQTRAQRLAHKIETVEQLYKDFIEEASRFYADALVHSTTDVSQLIRLYAMISRMRVLSSPQIVEQAEKIARMIVDTYLAPNKTFPELHDMVHRSALDPLCHFSSACREELSKFGYL